MLTFFNNIADDLGHTIQNLQDVSYINSKFKKKTLFVTLPKCALNFSFLILFALFLNQGRYCYLRGTHLKTSTSLFYINDVVIPTLTAMFDHLSACEYGSDLLCKNKLLSYLFFFIYYLIV